MDYAPDNQVFRKLKDNIARLKGQREEVVQQLGNDRTDLQTVESSIAQLTRELQSRLTVIKQKQRRLAQLEKTITETQKSYDIIVQTTQKLSNALEQESSHLRSRVRK